MRRLIIKKGEKDITLSDFTEAKQCHIMIYSYGKVNSVCLNKTQAKRVLNWLERWVKSQEGV